MLICPSELILDQLLDGTLPTNESQTLRDHLRACTICQNKLDSKCESPLLRDWTPTARRGAFDQDDSPLLAALLHNLEDDYPRITLPANQTASHPVALAFLTPSPVPGELGLLGDYRIQAEIGRGGMGIVLRAWDEKLNRCVAIKVVRPDLDDAGSRQRLVREAQAAASFRHDHAVTVHAVIDRSDAPPYLVMEHLAGPTLAEMLHERRPLRPTEAVDLLVGIADALAEAHKSGLIHRDVKPTNILLDRATGRAKLTDFGLARLEDRVSVTRESAVAGTPAYMSPEQAQGSKQLDYRTDIYSLGMTLYELLTGETPFHGAMHLVMRQVIQEEPQAPRQLNDEIPRNLETICLKAVAKEPGRRYQSAGLLADDLRRWKNGEPILARPAGRAEKTWRWCRRNPRVALLTGSVFTLLLAVGVGSSLVAFRLDADRAAIANERNEAVNAREKADASAAAARDHFEVALASLNSLLQEVKRLEASPSFLPLKKQLSETALKGLERIALSAERTPSADAGVLSAHEQLSDLYVLLGKTNEARAQLDKLLHRAEEWLAQEPASGLALRGLAKAHDRLGDLDKYNYQAATAAKHYQAAHDVRRNLHVARPGDLIVSRDLAVSLGKLADIKLDSGAYADAQTGFQNELEVLQSIRDAGGDTLESLRDFRFVESRLGQVCLSLCDYDAAEHHYGQALASARSLENTGVADAMFQVSLALEGLGITALRAGKTEEGVRNFERCLSVRRRIAKEAPGNAEAQRNMCTAIYNLADCLFQSGNLDQARARYEEARAIYEPLALADPGSLKRQMDLHMTLVQICTVDICAERYEAAVGPYTQLVAIWRKVEQNRDAAHLQPGATVKLLEADLAVLRKAIQLDLSNPAAANDLIPDLRAGVLALQSVHLARLGKHKEAASLADRVIELAPKTRRLYIVARAYALCAESLDRANANTALSTELKKLKAHYVDEALRHLADFRKLFAANPTIIVAHPDWNAIRKDPRFNKVVWNVQ